MVEGGTTSSVWMPVRITWSEHDQHVGVLAFSREVDGAQLRMPVADAEMVQQLTWSVNYVEAEPAAAPTDAVGAGSSALSADLASAGIVTRASWGARASRCTSLDPSKDRIAIHHSAPVGQLPC